MKTWIVLGTIFILVLTIGIFVSADLTNDKMETTNSGTCDSGSCPYASSGGCSEENNCGISTCGAVKGGSCGCGR